MEERCQIIEIREDSFKDKEEALEYLAEQLALPEYFGMNYDALHDCLGDLSDPVTMEFIGERGEESIGAVGTIRRIAEEVAEWNGNLKVTRKVIETSADEEDPFYAAAALMEEGGSDEEVFCEVMIS